MKNQFDCMQTNHATYQNDKAVFSLLQEWTVEWLENIVSLELIFRAGSRDMRVDRLGALTPLVSPLMV